MHAYLPVKIKHTLLLLATLLSFIQIGHCEWDRFRHYSIKDGLSGNNVTCFLQDKRGLVWIGTTDGLNRFDSRKFTIFRHNLTDSTTLGNNSILSLCEADNGEIWVGTTDGIWIYKPETERFRRLYIPKTPDNPEIEKLSDVIYSIIEDLDKHIWFSVLGKGVFKYEYDKNTLIQYYKDNNNNPSAKIHSNLATKFALDGKGDLYLTSIDLGIGVYDKQNDRFVNLKAVEPGTGNSPTYSFAITADSRGDLWVCAAEAFRYEKDDKSYCTKFSFDSQNIKGRYTTAVLDYAPNELLIATNYGLTILNTTFGTSQTIKYTPMNADGISDISLTALMKDNEGGLWIGSLNGGIDYMSPDANLFKHYTSTSTNNLFSGKMVTAFAEDEDGSIWIGTNGQGLFKFNPKNETFKKIDLGKEELVINTLLVDQDYLWIGTYSNSLMRLDRKGNVEIYTHKNGILSDIISVYSLHKDGYGQIWIGTLSGLYVHNPQEKTFTPVMELGLESTTAKIIEDDTHTLWIASRGRGLVSLELRSGKQTFYSQNNIVPSSVNTITIHKGKLYIGTQGYGLFIYDFATKEFVKHPSEIFNTHTTIESIISNYNEIWMTTNAGLLRLDPKKDNISCFSDDDGLQPPPYSKNATNISSTGQMYIGGAKGFDVLRPQAIPNGVSTPQVIFSSIRIGGERLEAGKSPYLNLGIDFQRKIKIPSTHSVIAIEFVTPDYGSPAQNNYRYRLKGFEKSWNKTDSHNNRASYTNLSPGTYYLEVQASGFDGVWNKNSSILELVILPPWWSTIWMWCIYIAIIILSAIVAYRAFIGRSIKLHQEKLKEMERENERKLFDAKIKLFTNVTHEIRTPVTLILAPLEQVMKNEELPDVVRNDLEVVKKNGERLLELVNQVLDFNKAEQAVNEINFTKVNICAFVTDIVSRFRPISEQRNIDLAIKCPSEAIFVKTDTEALTKIISNLLTNALKFTTDKIEVGISLDKDFKNAKIEIYDNGAGIRAADREKIFNTFYQGDATNNMPLRGFGIGLSIVDLLIKRINGNIALDSIEGEYTRFIITLPKLDDSVETDISSGSKDGDSELPAKSTLDKEILTDELYEEETSSMDMKERHVKEGTIMIVEDNEELITYLAKAFGKDFNVLTANNGVEALQEIDHKKPDLIISDIMMPIMDGMELCKRIKEDINLCHIPVILLTARVDTESKIAGLEIGADVYIEKPVSVNYLYAQVTSLLGNRNKLRNLFSEKPFMPISTIAENKADEKWLTKMNEVIQENIANADFSVDDLSKAVSMSRTLLFAKVKAVTGLTPNEFIRLVRLRKAAELLAGKEYKINEICYMVGYNSPSYFAKCFQTQFGVLPKEFIGKPSKP